MERAADGQPRHRRLALLNAAAEYVLKTAIPRPGETIQVDDSPAMEIVRVTGPTAHLLVATEFYGKLTRALQLVHPDDRGHFPWYPGYRGGRGGQPVLGVRAASPAGTRCVS